MYDVFEALIAERPYQGAIEMGHAREYILDGGGSIFDMDVVEYFSRSINPYPKDTRVLLNDRREGLVKTVNQRYFTRPIITIRCEENKKVTPYDIDLFECRNIVIKEVIYLFGFEK